MQARYSVQCNFLNTLQIRQSIPLHWRALLNTCTKNERSDNTVPGIFINHRYKNIHELKCKDYYWCFIEAKNHTPTCMKKWTDIYPNFNHAEHEIWTRIFRMPFVCTRETKLQSFQYKIIHRTIACNRWLFNIKVKESDKCNFCYEVDDIQHFLLYCDRVVDFWQSFFKWWNRVSKIVILDESELEECILFGFPNSDDDTIALNYCILCAKYYVYIQRLVNENRIDFYEFLVQLKFKLSIEKSICKQNNSLYKFKRYDDIYDSL